MPSLRNAPELGLPSPQGLIHDIAEQAFSRASGAPLVAGNDVRVLLDGQENYPAWLAAIREAQRTIFFENYIIEDDEVGRSFAEALAERARAGVKVRLIRDWLGSLGGASNRFWRELEAAGVEVRCFNPPRFSSPLGWLSRDHRKMISIDGRIGFVTGLCVSRRWLGEPSRPLSAWRDTGLELRGPALGCLERAFAQVWRETGAPLPPALFTEPSTIPLAGDVSLRIVADEPNSTGLFRLDQIIAAAARRTLWLTDAYFVGFAPYVQALRAAARDGVDVRLLVPSTSDIPLISPFSRAGYRPLLEAGVRVFEWNGTMIHAKTGVADGRWARIGSSNLNLASFVGNYELDAAIDDERVARELEDIYEEDLANSTEITLTARRRVRPLRPRQVPAAPPGSRSSLGAVRFANAVGVAAAASTRTLGAVESSIMLGLALILLAIAAVAVLWPIVMAYSIAAVVGWLSLTLFLRIYRNTRQRELEPPGTARSGLPE
ncbi:phospholipase D-like domain-containing protein [Stigmatella hybrida]|uniref:phospholipase D-like domain-containing protein n=1 Tax=Stigmatella hybrida TaxID=394097 RepID=UPI001CDA5AB2|nr:phospholipase D-like domain-containing protein [Stigmatella hybrida]